MCFLHSTLSDSNLTSPSCPPGVQPLPVRQRADASQRLLQEAGGQEVAQHGQSELHQEVNQALERRLVHAGDHPEGSGTHFDGSLLD